MTEELKIIADIFKDVTDGALYGVVFYMTMDLLKTIIIPGIWGYTIVKALGILTSRIGVKKKAE